VNLSLSMEKQKKMILKNSTVNLVQSKDMNNKAAKLAPTAKTVILPVKGINLEQFNTTYKSHLEGKNEVKILYVGRLHKIKGLDYLIKAFAVVNEKHPKTKLIIVGKGDKKEDLVRLAREKKCFKDINFVGEIEHNHLVEYYQKADVFVLPSFSEGLSNVIMEAMACGLPVIATDVGGNPELVKQGKGGFLVHPKNFTDLSNAISELIEKPELRKKMSDFNRNYVKRYDQKVILDKKMEIIDNVVNR